MWLQRRKRSRSAALRPSCYSNPIECSCYAAGVDAAQRGEARTRGTSYANHDVTRAAATAAVAAGVMATATAASAAAARVAEEQAEAAMEEVAMGRWRPRSSSPAHLVVAGLQSVQESSLVRDLVRER